MKRLILTALVMGLVISTQSAHAARKKAPPALTQNANDMADASDSSAIAAELAPKNANDPTLDAAPVAPQARAQRSTAKSTSSASSAKPAVSQSESSSNANIAPQSSAVGQSITETPSVRDRRNSKHTIIPVISVEQSQAFFSSNTTTNTYYNASYTDYQNRTLMGGGLMYEYGNGTFTGETGLLYIPVGFTSNGISANSNTFSFATQTQTSDVWRVDFIGVPLLAKLNFPITNSIKLTMKGGAIPVIPISASIADTYNVQQNGVTVQSGGSTTNSIDGTRSFNVIGEIGLGAQMPISSMYEVRLEAIYNRLGMPLMNQNGIPDIYTQSLVISLGLGMKL
jgi:hypothetical protein